MTDVAKLQLTLKSIDPSTGLITCEVCGPGQQPTRFLAGVDTKFNITVDRFGIRFGVEQ